MHSKLVLNLTIILRLYLLFKALTEISFWMILNRRVRMKNILIIYSTNEGQTLKICQRLQTLLVENLQKVTLFCIDEGEMINIEDFDKVIIGASIKYGKHSKKIQRFVKDNSQCLATKPNAFFSVNLVARKPEKNTPSTNPYLKKFLAQTAWEPNVLAVFAGKLNYPRYNLIDRLIIQLIMKMTDGPTDPSTEVEYTNWQQVEDFGLMINDL